MGLNIPAVVNGTVVMPDSGCLEGITRESTLDLCEELGTSAVARPVHAEELQTAEEVFMTTTAGSIMPVRSVDGKPVCEHGGAGAISIQLHNLYWEKRWAGWYGTPVKYKLAGKKP